MISAKMKSKSKFASNTSINSINNVKKKSKSLGSKLNLNDSTKTINGMFVI